jgi:hypothetical protein
MVSVKSGRIEHMRRRLITIAALLAFAAACSSNKRLESSPVETPAASTTAAVTTIEATTTTAAPTTTDAPTTTAAPTTAAPTTTAAPDYTLRGNGIGTWVFTDDAQEVVDALSAVFGAPDLDVVTEFPIVAGPGDYQNDAEEAFLLPFGRTVCFANTLCTVHGGESAEVMSFVGWYYASDEASTLSTAQGITLGSRWADHLDDMTVGEGGCYSDGGGTTVDEVSLFLRSSGTPFSGIDEAGNYAAFSPDPADVTVVQMQAGSQIGLLYGDC